MPASPFATLDEPLTPTPRFPVQSPDGKREWAEADRQATFRGRMRMLAPSLAVYANANAGKRNPRQAIKEGVVAGVFDMTVASGMVGSRFVAWVEFKGYDKGNDGRNGKPKRAPRAGELSPQQIDWGNKMYAAGHHVACFFDPDAAVEWIRSIAPGAFVGRVMA